MAEIDSNSKEEKKKYEVTIDLRPYTIEIEKVGKTYIVKMDNRVHEVRIKDINPEEKYALVEVNGETHHVRVDLEGNPELPIQIFLDGEPHEVIFKEKEELETLTTYSEISPLIKTPKKAAIIKQKGVITAPFNGTVSEIKVKVGDKVNPGDVVFIIDAMKMKNEIAADVEGVVKEILVKVNDPVKKGQSLLIIQPTSSN
ncbi:MAG: biotin/lipoyl-containing protein [Candidatus Asgardarchaeia archaeon]